MSEIDPLRQLGADHVIAEEFETSLEVLTATLRLFDTPKAAIDRIVDGFRANAYHALRADLTSTERRKLLYDLVPGIEFETHTLAAGAPAIGRTLRELDLRARTGATLLAVRRDTALIAVPSADWQFQPDDVLVLAGNPRQIADALHVLAGVHPPPEPPLDPGPQPPGGERSGSPGDGHP
jgi:CPA2 family monovalent cation:H+ antiporter-2